MRVINVINWVDKGLMTFHEEMRTKINQVKGISIPTVMKKIQAIVQSYQPTFEEKGVQLCYVKKFNGQGAFFWFEYVDIANYNGDAKLYNPTKGLSGTSSEYV